MRNIAFISIWLLVSSLAYAQRPYSISYLQGVQSGQSQPGSINSIPKIGNDSTEWSDPKKATVLA